MAVPKGQAVYGVDPTTGAYVPPYSGALPAGGSTSAKQDTGNSTLALILASLAPTANDVKSGEIAGSTSAAQMPTISCTKVMFVAAHDNAGRVYIGGAGVAIPNGSTDATTGYMLAASMQTPWIDVDNLNNLYYICNNAGDDLLYMATV